MKIVITGALGHIGSYLVIDILKKKPKSKIIIIDNLSNQRFATLFHFAKFKNIKFVCKDLVNENIDEEIKGAKVLIHLAALTDAQSSIEKPKEVKINNFNSTKNVLKSCAKYKVRLIFISSTSVYGTQDKIVDENCRKSELKPQSPYANYKLDEEKIIKNYFKKKLVSGVILRFGTIFGYSVGMRFHTAVNKFCWQVFSNKPITIWKTALHQKRPYLALKDASNAINLIIKKNIFDNEIYNIVTLNTTVNEIYKILKKYSNKVKIKYVHSKIMNQLSFEVSSKKFIKKGFVYKGNLKKEIFNTLNNLKKK